MLTRSWILLLGLPVRSSGIHTSAAFTYNKTRHTASVKGQSTCDPGRVHPSVPKHAAPDGSRPGESSLPIPVLKWDREVSCAELKLCGSLNFDACASVPSVGSQGAGERVVREVSHHLISIHDSKALSALTESAVLSEEEAVVPVSRQTEPGERGEAKAESLENTLPLQVQVKSELVVLERTKTVFKPALWCSEEQWERNKRAYVDSVKRHMKEQSGAANGVITELHSLMNSIASQKSGRNDPHWRHPSDLTRKNFRQSRLKGPSVSLDEWQKINLLAYRRFVNVPDIFHRSPVL